jgi:putative addiction module killer protein
VEASTPKEVEYYRDAGGSCPFEIWMDGLDASVVGRIDSRLRRVERGNLGECHPIREGNGISELIIEFGPGYRIYFWQSGDELLILHAGTKKTQIRDIEIAKNRLKSFMEEEDYGAQKS